MAEGGELQRSVVDSDFVYDFNCTVCIRKKSAYSEAVKYCPQCNEYFCKHCVGNAECDHDHLGRANVTRWGTPSTRHTFDECPRHRGNTLQLYCPREDVVCCYVCGQSRHRACGDLKYIPVIVSRKGNKTSLEEAVKEHQQLQTQLDKLLKDRTRSLNDLDNNQKQIKADIRAVKNKIISVLDNLEQNSFIEIDKLKNDLHDEIKSELQLLNKTNVEMQELLSKLGKSNADESLQFSRFKQSVEIIRDKKQPISDMATTRSVCKVRFVANTKLIECTKSLQGLGLSLIESHDKQHTKGEGKVSNLPQGRSSLKLNHSYKVGDMFYVNFKRDNETCDIWGMCQLPGGNIMIANGRNNSLNQLDSTYKVTSYCNLSASPFDVCNTEKGEVAVALGFGIQFVSVGDKLTATRSFSTRHDCRGLAYRKKSLYVRAHGCSTIYVYKTSGSLQHTICTDRFGVKLFSYIMCITTSPVSDQLYVVDWKGLLTMTPQGKLLATLNPLELQGARAVCLDRAGNVFVGGCGTVLQVRQEGGRKVAQIVSPSDDISIDNLCFDNVNSRLLVANSGTVAVLNLTQ